MKLIRPEFSRSGTLDSWLQDFFSDTAADSWAGRSWPSIRDFAGLARGVRTDFYEDAENYRAVMELPGVKKADLKVEVEHSVLTVSGKRPLRPGGEGDEKFFRSISVPDSVDSSKIQAELRDGLLLVVLPKDESQKVRTIEVK
jgi:HSP20 family protein